MELVLPLEPAAFQCTHVIRLDHTVHRIFRHTNGITDWVFSRKTNAGLSRWTGVDSSGWSSPGERQL